MLLSHQEKVVLSKDVIKNVPQSGSSSTTTVDVTQMADLRMAIAST